MSETQERATNLEVLEMVNFRERLIGACKIQQSEKFHMVFRPREVFGLKLN